MPSLAEPRFTHLLRTRAYLRALPDGLASYPECLSKASVWNNILRWTDTSALAGRVPDDLPLVPDRGMLTGAWIPVVQSFAAHLVLRDCLFTSDDQMTEHFRMMDRQLLSGPLYRVLFALSSPSLTVLAARRQFATLFRGIALTAAPSGECATNLELSYPAMILPTLVARLYLVAFEVALEMAGAVNVEGRMLDHGPTTAHYELSWR